MKTKNHFNLKAIGMLLAIVILTKLIEWIPWWGAVVPATILAMVLKRRGWPIRYFSIGFLIGFAIWFGSDVYFDIHLNGIALSRIGQLFSIPKVVVMAVSGLIGGILIGLAFYMGKSVFDDDRVAGWN